jgi:serine/threonine protein kinase
VIRVMERLSHPNIVRSCPPPPPLARVLHTTQPAAQGQSWASRSTPLYARYLGSEQGESEYSLNVFMEFVSGGSLLDQLGEWGPLNEAVVRSYTLQMLNGACGALAPPGLRAEPSRAEPSQAAGRRARSLQAGLSLALFLFPAYGELRFPGRATRHVALSARWRRAGVYMHRVGHAWASPAACGGVEARRRS